MSSTPTSTYRLQVTADFTLTDAAEVTDYLSDLGVGAVYLSPVLASTDGSTHGYDTVDPTRIDGPRGGEEGWQALLAAARAQALDVVVDIVPNHLGVADAAANPAWWDVLQHGRDSAYARWFDIDWSRPRIILPVLGDDPELSIVGGELRYAEHRFPLAPGSWDGADTDRAADIAAVRDRQHYELVHWSRGDTDLNYRRFFSITTLAGVRQEDPEVFDATHARIRDWVADSAVQGLRIDHPDGLVDPLDYLEKLRALAPGQWITVEKILEPGEVLPPEWPADGTTGYDAMREVNGVFVDPASADELTAIYRRLTGDDATFAEHVEVGKRRAVMTMLPAEVRRMAALAPDVPDAGPALAEVAVAFSVYRSYLPTGVEHLDEATARAARTRPELAPALEALAPRLHDPSDELARRLQQLSGATMAKGVEDTAYYRYARFLALNEVGADPDEVGIDLDAFHRLQQVREEAQPRSMTALSTHDTKRGEDVRARLAVLSEMPQRWAAFAAEVLDAAASPHRPFAYLMAQMLAGAGPIERDRLQAYAEKAMREAGEQTTYTDPDPIYEDAVHADVDRAYDDPDLRRLWDELEQEITPHGWSNALGQKLVQLTMPGIPDVYQGTELWDDSLVDPDNRRPVDFDLRRSLLASTTTSPAVDASGAAKLWVVAQTLRLRCEQPQRFTGYRPIRADGPAADHAIAYERSGVVAVATRLPVGLQARGGWAGTTLPLEGRWVDQLSGRTYEGSVALADLLASAPVALLVEQ